MVDSLKRRFPVEDVGPYGRVLTIPSRQFLNGWEPALESEGHKVFAGSRDNQAVFYVRLEETDLRKVETPQNKGTSVQNWTKGKAAEKVEWKRWRPKETDRLKDMLERGLPVEEVAGALGRTAVNVERKIRRLERKGELDRARPEPDHAEPSTPTKNVDSNFTPTVKAPNPVASPPLNLEGATRMVKVTFLDHAGVENMPLTDIMESGPLPTVMAGIPIRETEQHLTLLTMYEKPTSHT